MLVTVIYSPPVFPPKYLKLVVPAPVPARVPARVPAASPAPENVATVYLRTPLMYTTTHQLNSVSIAMNTIERTNEVSFRAYRGVEKGGGDRLRERTFLGLTEGGITQPRPHFKGISCTVRGCAGLFWGIAPFFPLKYMNFSGTGMIFTCG